MNFKAFLNISEYANTAGAVLVPTSWTGSEAPDTMSMTGKPNFLPGIDVGLPSVHKSGQIAILVKNKNPIYVQLSDGTKLFFNVDEFRRIKGFPEIGRTMSIVFQRRKEDLSELPSIIQSCQIS